VSVRASITPRLTVNTRVCMCVRGSKLKDMALGSRFKMIEARSFFALDAVDALLHRPRPHHDGTVLGGPLIQQQQTVTIIIMPEQNNNIFLTTENLAFSLPLIAVCSIYVSPLLHSL